MEKQIPSFIKEAVLSPRTAMTSRIAQVVEALSYVDKFGLTNEVLFYILADTVISPELTISENFVVLEQIKVYMKFSGMTTDPEKQKIVNDANKEEIANAFIKKIGELARADGNYSGIGYQHSRDEVKTISVDEFLDKKNSGEKAELPPEANEGSETKQP